MIVSLFTSHDNGSNHSCFKLIFRIDSIVSYINCHFRAFSYFNFHKIPRKLIFFKVLKTYIYYIKKFHQHQWSFVFFYALDINIFSRSGKPKKKPHRNTQVKADKWGIKGSSHTMGLHCVGTVISTAVLNRKLTLNEGG